MLGTILGIGDISLGNINAALYIIHFFDFLRGPHLLSYRISSQSHGFSSFVHLNIEGYVHVQLCVILK